MEHALIIGGGGFIGRRLARKLAATGVRVTVADHSPPLDSSAAPGVEHLIQDVRRLSPDHLPAGPDTTIYLLAAVHRTPGHESEEYFETNVTGARRVAAFAAATGVRRIVFTSSIAVYGPGEARKSEATTPKPETAYGWSKLLAEFELRGWAEDDPYRQLVIARPAVVFGPGEGGNFSRLAAALRRRIFAYPGRRDTIKGCCYVDDLIDSFAFALASGQRELIYNFAYPEAYSIEAICEAFSTVGDLPRPLGCAPQSALNTIARVCEGLERVGLATGVNRARIAKLTRSTHIAPARLESMGYRFPTDLRSGLAAWRDEAGAFV